MSGATPIAPSDADFDPVSQRFLPVLRHILSNLQGDAPLSWRNAFTIAVEVWGEARGLAIAFRAEAFLSALLASRPVHLRVADPLNPEERAHLTEDEISLLALLTYMRADETPAARDRIAALTGGRVEPAVVRTGLDLARLLGGPPGHAVRRKAPRLAIVAT